MPTVKASGKSFATTSSAKPQAKTAKPVHANRGTEARYRRRMIALVDEMTASFEYWLAATYRASPPRMAELVAKDASPANEMRKRLKELAQRWIKRFDDAAPLIAEAYLRGSFKASDSAMRAALKDAGWTVDFKMTATMRDAFDAALAENVGLIRSIPRQYLTQVEGVVMRGYGAGRDLGAMTTELKQLYPAAAHRAELIARDQSNKANAVVNRARSLELGITEAIWHHSHAGKVPRPDHVAAHGKRYNIAEGCLISGEYIQPGTEINCRCTSRVILPF